MKCDQVFGKLTASPESIARWNQRIGRRIDHHLLHDFELEVFCVPVPSAS
jgi:hypothetical protein